MMKNKYQGQLTGPFPFGVDLFKENDIKASKIGIIADYDTIIELNGKPICIGKKEMYETNHVAITSLIFIKPDGYDSDYTDYNTIIDYILYEETKPEYNPIM